MSKLDEAFESIGIVCNGASVVYAEEKENTIYFEFEGEKYKFKLEKVNQKTKTLKRKK
jgi:hypothetical protein